MAVVGHSNFLRRFSASKFDEKGMGIDEKRFANCEVYEYNLE